jgi:hypothetical protein
MALASKQKHIMQSFIPPTLIILLFLSACATSSPIQSYKDSKSAFGEEPELIKHDIPDNQIYRVYHRAATGFVPIQAIRETAEKRAIQFCQEQGKSMLTLGERISEPPYILGNFPRIELVFACTEKPTNEDQNDFKDEKYIKLVNLKKLLDNGIITQEEFQQQKQKILGDYTETPNAK